MDALIAQVAVAIVPKPVPIIVDGAEAGFAMRRLEGRGPAPEVIIHGFRRLLRSVDFADAVPRLVAEAARHVNLAEFAGLEKIHRLSNTGGAANLRARL